MTELTVQAIIENIPRVTEFIDGQLEAVDCSIRSQMQIDVAIDELLANIASYAYETGEGQVTVRFDFQPDNRTVALTFIDSGIPYDPLAKADPDVSLSAEERQIGGLGIFMVKKSMDDMQYRYENGKNILTIRKRLANQN